MNNKNHPVRVDLIVYTSVGVALLLALATLYPGTPVQLGIISALLSFVGGILGAYTLGKRK